MSLNIKTKLKLNDGNEMPQFGLGVYLSKEGDECKLAIQHAINDGYRLIDTASFYNNEASVGEAVKTSSIQRGELFITSKLWNTDHGYDQTLRAFDKTMDRLGMDYLDLYLVHYPVEGIRKDTWKAMEEISKDERCRSIGVSNYLESHLTELLDTCQIPPSVNQIELSPYCYNSRLPTIEFCEKADIIVQSYAPLTRGKMFQEPERINENASIFDFELTAGEQKSLESVKDSYIICWDPSVTP